MVVAHYVEVRGQPWMLSLWPSLSLLVFLFLFFFVCVCDYTRLVGLRVPENSLMYPNFMCCGDLNSGPYI